LKERLWTISRTANSAIMFDLWRNVRRRFWPDSGASFYGRMFGGGWMKTVRLEVRPLEEAAADFARAWKTGRAEREARISFETPELLWKVLTAKRWELLRVMAGQEPMTIREVADRVGPT
jgi:hypothetical protein